jgi:hypothetical protein
MNCEDLLDWIVAMDLGFYKTETFKDYDPKCDSHFYIKGSPERFSSEEIIKIFNNKADDDLNERWQWALTEKKK